MIKSTLAVSALALTISAGLQQRLHTVVPLDQGTMTLEHIVGGETVVRIEADSEVELRRVGVWNPAGEPLLDLEETRAGHRGLTGLLLEMRESSLEELFAHYVEGDYLIRASTVDGALALGSARLSFDLAPAPRVLHPLPGAVVPGSGLTVRWLSHLGTVEQRSVAGYRLQLEQGETDGLAVTLPPGSNSFRVPDGLLASGTLTQLEIAAIASSGNHTVVEVVFATQP